MPLYPNAVHEILPANTKQAHIAPTAVIVHSAAGAAQDLYGWWMNPNAGGLECHFYVATDGTVYQYMDTVVRADANVQANGYGISIETENNKGHTSGGAFMSDVWTAPQQASLVRLIDWCCTTHNIRRELCADGRHGIGWHDQYPQWTTPGHVCPGTARIQQLQTQVIPAVAGGTAPTTSQEDELDAPQAKQLSDTAAMLPAVFVDVLYRTYGKRDPDPSGLEYWSSQVAATNPLTVLVKLKAQLGAEATKAAK